jgi:Kef-type K+ transport system membrane component KefB
MLNKLLRHSGGIGQVLALVACTATVIYFQYFFEWTWYVSIPVGVLAFISTLVLWVRFIDYLEKSQLRS